MTWDQYWYGPAWMVEAFLEADKIKRERDNAFAHLQGLYIYEALCDVSPVLHAFAQKGTKPTPYPDSPYDLPGERTQSEEEREKQEEQERLKAELYMMNMVRQGKNWGKH